MIRVQIGKNNWDLETQTEKVRQVFLKISGWNSKFWITLKEDALYWRAVTKHDEEKIAKRNSLNDFKILDSQKKQERAIKASEEVKQDYIKDNENFNEYLRHSKEMEVKRFGKANEIKTFWDKQSADLAENRRNRLQNDVDYQEATKKREAVGKYPNFP